MDAVYVGVAAHDERRDAEVGQRAVVELIDQDVGWLQVRENDVLRVKLRDARRDLRAVALRGMEADALALGAADDGVQGLGVALHHRAEQTLTILAPAPRPRRTVGPLRREHHHADLAVDSKQVLRGLRGGEALDRDRVP